MRWKRGRGKTVIKHSLFFFFCQKLVINIQRPRFHNMSSDSSNWGTETTGKCKQQLMSLQRLRAAVTASHKEIPPSHPHMSGLNSIFFLFLFICSTANKCNLLAKNGKKNPSECLGEFLRDLSTFSLQHFLAHPPLAQASAANSGTFWLRFSALLAEAKSERV